MKKKVKRLMTEGERTELYEEVWNEPITQVAPRYNLSDTGLRKQCKKLGIPVPPRGYWKKVESGIAVKQAILPYCNEKTRPYILTRFNRNELDEIKDKCIRYNNNVESYWKAFIKAIAPYAGVKASDEFKIKLHPYMEKHIKKTKHIKEEYTIYVEQKDNDVFWFDEIDKSAFGLFPIAVCSATQRKYANKILNMLLNMIDDFDGVIINAADDRNKEFYNKICLFGVEIQFALVSQELMKTEVSPRTKRLQKEKGKNWLALEILIYGEGRNKSDKARKYRHYIIAESERMLFEDNMSIVLGVILSMIRKDKKGHFVDDVQIANMKVMMGKKHYNWEHRSGEMIPEMTNADLMERYPSYFYSDFREY